jgi:exosortase/archaeosortase family protein
MGPGWKRLVLVLVVLPIVCCTNGLRMFVLAMLANYVDPAFFYGNLHHHGGIFFFALALLLLALVTRELGGRLAVRARIAPQPA